MAAARTAVTGVVSSAAVATADHKRRAAPVVLPVALAVQAGNPAATARLAPAATAATAASGRRTTAVLAAEGAAATTVGAVAEVAEPTHAVLMVPAVAAAADRRTSSRAPSSTVCGPDGNARRAMVSSS
jgi:hypothetical protein